MLARLPVMFIPVVDGVDPPPDNDDDDDDDDLYIMVKCLCVTKK